MVRLVKPLVFLVVMYGCESWTIKKDEHQRTDVFELWVKIRRTILLNKRGGAAGSGSKELTLGAALIDFQGSVRGHSSLSRHPSGIYYPS